MQRCITDRHSAGSDSKTHGFEKMPDDKQKVLSPILLPVTQNGLQNKRGALNPFYLDSH